jgi:hypothetical protein
MSPSHFTGYLANAQKTVGHQVHRRETPKASDDEADAAFAGSGFTVTAPSL